MKYQFTRLVRLLLIALLCGQAAAPIHSFAAQSVSDQVSELICQQIEAWKTPAPQATLTWFSNEGSASPTTSGQPFANDVPTASQFASVLTPADAQLIKKIVQPRPKLTVRNEPLQATVMLARFYEEREYRPAWSDNAEPLSRADMLIDAIQREAEREGLRAGDYRLAKLRKLLGDVRQQRIAHSSPNPRALADLDFLLTDAFLTYGARVSTGKTNLDVMDAQWFEKRRKADLAQVLQTAVTANRLEDVLKILPPQHHGYTQLRTALAQLRDLAARGGWPRVPRGFDLHPGDPDERAPKLRARLQVTGELASPSQQDSLLPNEVKARKNGYDEDKIYEATLVQAVKRFQNRHGLTPDGVVGGGTLAALNVPVETRIRQIMVNMNRWRALPQNLGARHIAVNIPNFALDVVEYDQPTLHMRVVVGKMIEKRNTPTFNAQMTHVVLNPYWYVPKSIAEKELFPLSKKNPEYFTENKFIVRRVEVGEKQAPDPNAADGSLISTKVYQYFLKQAPGPKNALGRVKFMFPNVHGVYLHDTPSKELFNRAVRMFSHGCIRVEKPIDLAEHLLHGSEKWTRDEILATIERKKERTVWLPEPIPVYIQYWTAWVDDEGAVQFRNDIYGYDDVPGARLPVSVAKNPRPEPEPEVQPLLQEVHPTPQPDALPLAAQPAPQLVSPAETHRNP